MLEVININIATHETVCRIQQSMLYFSFLWKSVDTVLIIFTNPFADTLFEKFIFLSHTITESSIILFRYSTFSNLHVEGFHI